MACVYHRSAAVDVAHAYTCTIFIFVGTCEYEYCVHVPLNIEDIPNRINVTHVHLPPPPPPPHPTSFRWHIELSLTPSHLVYSTAGVLCALAIGIAIIIGLLQAREKVRHFRCYQCHIQCTLRITDTLVHGLLSFIQRVSFIGEFCKIHV